MKRNSHLGHLGPERQMPVLSSVLQGSGEASATSWNPPWHTGFKGHLHAAPADLPPLSGFVQ